jgi:hypothetical protein
VFVHLLGPAHPDGSPLWAQDDHPPQNGRISAKTWDTSIPFRDVYRRVLPADAPPGSYTITTGWYDPSGNRLSVESSLPQPEDDAASVLTFTLP